jgi:hypothetical protein
LNYNNRRTLGNDVFYSILARGYEEDNEARVGNCNWVCNEKT